MGQPSRRGFCATGALGLLALARPWRTTLAAACEAPAALPAAVVAPKTAAQTKARARFATWLAEVATAGAPEVTPLVYAGPLPVPEGGAAPTAVSTAISAEAGLWHLRQGRTAAARAIAARLLRFQQGRRDGVLARSAGAMPERIVLVDGQWRGDDRFLAGDNLAVLALLIALVEVAGEPDLLNAAIGIGTWLVDVMCRGDAHGVWAEPHGAPMAFVTRAGDFGNALDADRAPLWMSALARLGRVTGEAAYCRQAERAGAFYLTGQHAAGGFFDRYEPGWPPEAFDVARWTPAAPGTVRATHALHAALGLVHLGAVDAAQKTLAWVRRDGDGVATWLELDSGRPATIDGDDGGPYDVGATAAFHALAVALGDAAAARTSAAALARWQAADGGFPLAVDAKRRAITAERSASIGLWATADLRTIEVAR
ncbi:MAG: hypothetical protein R2939_23190 [Kofleriaceae bacterium]